MNVEINDSDSNDDEIFVLKQFKPVLINSSPLRQLTLEETSKSKGSGHFLNNSSNEKVNEKGRRKKRSIDLNETRSKKMKRGVSVSDTHKKITNAKSDSQSVNRGRNINVGKLNKSPVKNIQKSIQSYFVRKTEVKLKEIENAEKVKIDSSLEIINEWELDKDTNIKCEKELLEVENTEINDISKSVVTDVKIKNVLIMTNNTETGSLEEECKGEKSCVNIKECSDIGESFTIKGDSNMEEFHSFEGFENDFFNDETEFSGKGKYIDHSELLCYHFKKIISEEMKKQVAFKSENLSNGKIIENLILENESEIMGKFLNLNERASRVFIRMLGRKKGWHRVSTINYPGISNNLNTEFEILHKEGFIDINIEDENLKTQIELLNKGEILELCKAFNVSVKSNTNNSYKKETLISCLMSNSEKQKSALDMFKVKNSTTRQDILKSKIKTCLGSCVRVNNIVFQAFYKILLLFSFAHYRDEESKRFSNELFMWLQVLKNNIRFPNYKLSPTVVFETLEDFEEYKNSLLVQDSFESAIINKNYSAYISLFNQATVEFKKLLENKEYVERFLNLKTFLRKFSAGTIYAKILTKYCKTFKKQSNNSEIANIAQLLLNQDLFLTGKKGEWYEILSKALENQKQCNAAAEIIIKSLKDPKIDEVQKFTLQLRGLTILKKKTCGITDDHLRDLLSDLCTSSVKEPPSIEIKGKALEGNAGFKSIYVQQLEDGKVYASVEERAIIYYKSKGFSEGYHSEGYIIQTIYFLLFFDIIYESSPEGVFQSPYQTAPLDWSSGSFFHNRKEKIELLLNDMLKWDQEQIQSKIKDSYYKNYNTSCVINWNEKFTPELFCDVIKCITMPILVSIFKRLLRNFRIFRSGFPDLTLWNPDTNNCKFVEVKSPNDKLSPAQRIWLDYLRNIGLDCEVCNVKNFSSKSF